MQNAMMLFTLFVFEWKDRLWVNLVKKSKLSVEAEIWYLRQFQDAEFSDAVHFFCFLVEISFLGKFGPKSQNYQLKVKFVTQTNSNMLNSMMLFTFFLFDWKRPSWANLVQIVNIYSFFLFPIRNVLFSEKLVQNTKVSLRLNLLVTIFCKIYLEFSRFH